jgi:hypothetical protein
MERSTTLARLFRSKRATQLERQMEEEEEEEVDWCECFEPAGHGKPQPW